MHKLSVASYREETYRMCKSYRSCMLPNGSLLQVVLNSINASLQQLGKHHFESGSGELLKDYLCPGCSAHQLLIYRDPGHLARTEAARIPEAVQPESSRFPRRT